MELNELTREEQVALVALLELVIESDAGVSESEAEQIDRIVDKIGEDAYRSAAEEADDRFQDEDDLKAFLPTITRQDARECIYEAILEAAIPDAIGVRESELLEWLAQQWNVAVEFEGPEGSSAS